MINLAERPEKFQASLQQLEPYGIIPYCFSAVNGWNLPLTVVNALGTPYEFKMGLERRGTSFPIGGYRPALSRDHEGSWKDLLCTPHV